MPRDPSPARPRIRVLIADDHPVMRRGLREMLGDEQDLRVVGEATCRDEVEDALAATPCDVVVLDLGMPGVLGFELIEAIHTTHPAVGVIVLSMQPEEQFGLGALRAGATGYLTKESAPDELLVAIRRVANGARYISPRLAEHLAAEAVTPRPPSLHERLSRRERQVLAAVGRGRRVKEIAEELTLSEKTVSTYRTRLLQKLLLGSTAELIRYALEHGLSEPAVGQLLTRK